MPAACRPPSLRGLGGTRPLDSALEDHHRQRDRAVSGSYGFTLGLAAFRRATRGQRHFLAAVAADQEETDRFLSAFTGIEPPEHYFTLSTAVRILGSRRVRTALRMSSAGR